MNEELQKAVAEMLNNAIAVTGKASDFMIEEIPDVVHQLLMWKMVYSAVTSVIAAVLLCAFIAIGVKTFNHYRQKNKGNYEAGMEFFTLLLIIPGGISLLSIDFVWLQIWIAPKVYLMEYVATMVTK